MVSLCGVKGYETKGRKENAMHRAQIREVISAHIMISVTASRQEKSRLHTRNIIKTQFEVYEWDRRGLDA